MENISVGDRFTNDGDRRTMLEVAEVFAAGNRVGCFVVDPTAAVDAPALGYREIDTATLLAFHDRRPRRRKASRTAQREPDFAVAI